MGRTARLIHSASAAATATLSVGQKLSGKSGSYQVLHQLQKGRDVWTAV